MRRSAALAFLVLAACTGAGTAALAPVPMTRYGSGRASIEYIENEAAAKRVLLERINSERAAAGLSKLAYDLLAAKVGDEFCLDSASSATVGHWDLAGRPPYYRWAKAGGVDYHAQNLATRSRTGYALREPTEQLLLAGHKSFMDETPPDDGHRRTILDPIWTHVGIGCARVGGEFRMTEEFTRHVADWVEVPSGRVKAGRSVKFSARFPMSYTPATVEFAYEKPHRAISRAENARRGEYRYPSGYLTLRPLLPDGLSWAGGGRGDFSLGARGELSLPVTLDHGPGSYYVIVYVRSPGGGSVFSPGVAALIEAD